MKNYCFCILGIWVALSSCAGNNECPDQEPSKHTEYNLNPADVSKIPYTGTDTLVFISNTGDTATLYGQGKKQYRQEVATNRSSDPGCPFFDYDYCERINIKFNGDNPLLKELILSYNVNEESADKASQMTVIVNEATSSRGLIALNAENRYADTMTIKGIIYNGERFMGFRQYENDSSLIVFYNCRIGLLQLVFFESKSWVLNIP
jgi:hypothetical protein